MDLLLAITSTILGTLLAVLISIFLYIVQKVDGSNSDQEIEKKRVELDELINQLFDNFIDDQNAQAKYEYNSWDLTWRYLLEDIIEIISKGAMSGENRHSVIESLRSDGTLNNFYKQKEKILQIIDIDVSLKILFENLNPSYFSILKLNINEYNRLKKRKIERDEAHKRKKETAIGIKQLIVQVLVASVFLVVAIILGSNEHLTFSHFIVFFVFFYLISMMYLALYFEQIKRRNKVRYFIAIIIAFVFSVLASLCYNNSLPINHLENDKNCI
ncbi:MAG: hypothetical protein K8R68_11595, partial [Bacteroidales bacterium]|nr:hypothetical protein [Bacteroidales bacterium]